MKCRHLDLCLNPRKRNQYHKDLVYITRIDLFNSSKKKVDILKFHEKSFFEIEVDSVKALDDVILMIGFMNDDHDKITYSASNDGFNQKVINISEGINKFNVELEQQLIPGIIQCLLVYLIKRAIRMIH